MPVELARITARGQTTIPKRIREAAGLRKGDVLAFDLVGDQLRVRKVMKPPDEYLRAVQDTMHEWNSKEDEIAWRDL